MMSLTPEHASASYAPLVDTLRLSRRKWLSIVSQMERGQRVTESSEKRVDDREPAGGLDVVVMELIHPGGSKGIYLVHPRNISTSGMCFYHGAYVYPQSRTNIKMLTRSRKVVSVKGVIRRCRHYSGKLHEVGIKFDEKIDISGLAGPIAEP